MALALVLVPLSRSVLEFALAILAMPVGTALLFPSTTSIVSRRAGDTQTGLILGVQQAFGGVARMAGPLWAGLAFQQVGIESPFWLAAGLMLGVRIFAGVVREESSSAVPLAESEPVLPPEAS